MFNILLAQAQQQVQQATQAAQAVQQAATDAAAPVAEMTTLGYMKHFFVSGGIWMVPIAIVMAWGTIIAIHRFMRIYFKFSIDAESFFSKIQKYVLEDSPDRAINLCNGQSGSLLPSVLKSGLIKAKGSEAEVQSAVDEATLEALPEIEKGSLYLPLIANVATLLGLLGTIIGLIQAFASLATAAPDQRAAALSGAIAVAMNTTAFGLIVAIPLMLAHTMIQARANKILADIDHYAVKLVNLLASAKKR